MKRRLFNSVSALSLILVMALGVLWVRSYRVTEEIGYRWRNRGGFGLGSDYGSIDVVYNSNPPAKYAPGFSYHLFSSARVGEWSGFRYQNSGTSWIVRFPYWLAILPATVPPVLWLIGERQRRRHLREGCCAKCGYDLRASKARCPECGTGIPAQAADRSRRPASG